MVSPLAGQQSAYLRSAKDQPVQWLPWGPEAFARARAEAKPILLDVGAVWCHWCHVMDHESYENPAVADILNDAFVCIKVDRDERPDVDARYQRAVQGLTGQGGWPLTAFLTPHGEVFYGGTYFPPDDRHGRPGFPSVLKQIASAYRTDADKVVEQAREIARQLTEADGRSRAGSVTPEVIEQAADQMARAFDLRHGGFGTTPKFPHPGAVDFVLTRWFDTRASWAWEIVERTLDAMALGGIRDHVGGGFHRYSVDARWIVPHFEKMIYDNAELLRVYVHAAAAAAKPLWDDVIRDTADWIAGSMSDPAGGYYASQDADLGPGDDGDYFTWSPDEVRAAVDDAEFSLLVRHFDVEEVGDMHGRPHRNVLWMARTAETIARETRQPVADVEAQLAAGRAKLRVARAKRKAPYVDTTIYTAWSAMTASAMLAAGTYLDRRDLEAHAIRTLHRLWAEAADEDGGLRHAVGSDVGGLLDDQVQMARAVLDAYEVTGERQWLERATVLMDLVWTQYRHDAGGLRDRATRLRGEGFLDLPIVPTQDAPTPSPNGVAGLVYCRLAEHTGESRWQEHGMQLLEELAGTAAELSVFAATLLQAIDWAVHPPTHVAVVGATDADPLHRAALRAYRPRKVIHRLRPGDQPDTLPSALVAMLTGDAPRAYVCAGMACAAPVADEAGLANTLRSFGVVGV